MEEKQKKVYVSKTSKRFILSFFIVLMVPVICFIFLFQRNFRDIYRNKVIEQAQKNLDTIGMDLSRRIEGLCTLVEFNSVGNKIQKAVSQGEKGNSTVMDTLYAALVSYSFLEDVYYYNQSGPEQVYSSTGTYTLHYFAKLKGGLESKQQLLDRLKEIEGTGWMFLGTDLVYAVKDVNLAWWIFEFDKVEMKKLLVSENALTTLLDYEGKELYTMGMTESQDCYETVFVSPQKSFRIVRETEEKYFFGELDYWQRNFILVVILILLLGGFFVLILTYYNEKPFKRLLAYSRERIPDIPADMDGLEAFQFALKTIEERSMYKAAKHERNNLLLKLIYGQNCDTESFKNSMKAALLFEKAQCYRVIVIASLGGQEININKIELYLNMQEKSDYEFRLTDLSREDATVMVVGMTEMADQGLENELMLMFNTIGDSINGGIRFFVGGKCTKLSEIHLSYSQAYSCGQRNANEETGTVVFYKSIQKNSKEYQYPKAEISILYDALVEADLEKVSYVTEHLIAILEEQSQNRFVSVALYYDILNAYYRALTKLERDEEFDLAESDILIVNESIDAVRMIYRIRDKYQSFVEKSKGEDENKSVENGKRHKLSKGKEKGETKEKDIEESKLLVGRVLAFIDANIKSGELNVSSVADYFNMSISHMSHKFKEQTNRNISDYITEKKFAYACELLDETELSVKEITFITGYSHPYSFIRKFKQQYGVTPGEYRGQKRE